MSASSKFHWKVFVSFYVVFSFLALAVSGIVLYVAPPGRIANWSVWQLLLLSKAQWQAVHTIVALAFLVAAGFHIYFNWKVLVAYLKSKLQAGIRMKRELAAASLTGAAILAVSITGMPPFGTVMDVGEDIKNSWSTTASEPPIPHAELMTVAEALGDREDPHREGRGESREAGDHGGPADDDGAADRGREQADAAAGLPEDPERRREAEGEPGRGRRLGPHERPAGMRALQCAA